MNNTLKQKRLSLFVCSLFLVMAGSLLHAQEQEEVWRTYELVTKTSDRLSFNGGSGYLIVIDTFALSGHNLKLDTYSTSIVLAKIDQIYKSKIITRVSTSEKDSLPREFTFKWKDISTTFVKKSYWMIYDSLKLSTKNIPQYLNTGYIFRASIYGICFNQMNGTAEPTSRTEFQIEEPSVSYPYYLRLNYDEGNGPFSAGVVYESYYNTFIKPQNKRAPYFAFWDVGSSYLSKDDRRVTAMLYKRVDKPCCNEVSGVKVVQIDSTSVSVNWNEAHPKPAIGYKISIEKKEDNTIVKEDTISGNLTTYTYKGLQELTDYTFSVTSVCGEDFSSDPIAIDFRTKFTSCLPVSNVIVDPQQSDVSLQWTAPKSPSLLDSSFYQITINGGEISALQNVADIQSKPFCPDYACFAANTTYNYSITTVCSDGSFSVPSIPVKGQFTTQPCPKVSEVQITPMFTHASLSWNHNPITCTGYHILLSSQNQNPVEVDFYPQEDETTVNYRFDTLLMGNLYTYTITPFCRYGGFGESSSGEFTTLLCKQVSNVQTEVGLRYVTLSWNAPELPPYAYHIKITNTEGRIIKETTVKAPETSIQYPSLDVNTTYFYSIDVQCTEDISGDPVTGQFTTQPCPKISNVQTEVGLTNVKLSWDAPERGVYRYHIILTDETEKVVSENYSDSKNPFYSYSYLNPNTTYTYSIASGCTTTGESEPVTGQFTTLTCQQVHNVQTEVGLTNVKLSWDTLETIPYAYHIKITDIKGNTIKENSYYTSTATSFSCSSLDPNTTYNYSIVTRCTSNANSEPVTGQFTTLRCEQVSNVQTEVGITNVKIYWDTPEYEVYGFSVILTDETGDVVSENSNSGNPFSYSYLKPNTTYNYSIVTRCSYSIESEPVTGQFTTLACPQFSNVQANVGITKVKLSWDAPDYEVYGYYVILSDEMGNVVVEGFYYENPFSYEGLESNTTYNYSIAARCSYESESEPVTGQFTTLACPQVSNVQAKVGVTDVGLSWNVECEVYGYLVMIVTSETGQVVLETISSEEFYHFSSLEPNTTYTYIIATRCSYESESEPVTGQFTTLACPQVSNVQANVGVTKVKLSWDAPEYEVDGYYVILSDEMGNVVEEGFYSENPFSYDGLEPNTTYNYSIAAKCSYESESEPVTGQFTTLSLSNSDECGQDSNVSVDVGVMNVVLSWEAPKYEIYGYHVTLIDANGDVITDYPDYYTDSIVWYGLEPNTTYKYSITVRCTEYNESEPFIGKFTTLACPQVSNVQAKVGVTDIGLSWARPDYKVYGYRVMIVTSEAGQVVLETISSEEFYYFSSLEPNTTYAYIITTKCTENSEGESVAGEFTTLSSDCGQVSNVSVNAGVNKVTLDWESPKTEHLGYNVTLSENRPSVVGSNTTIVSRDVSDTWFSYSNLKPNTDYLYNIIVNCRDGISGEPVKGNFKTLNNVGNTVEGTTPSTQIYPNPNTGEAIIETSEAIRMEILSSTGVLLETSNLSAGKHTVQFPSKGVFMVRFSNPSGTTVRRIIVL